MFRINYSTLWMAGWIFIQCPYIGTQIKCTISHSMGLCAHMFYPFFAARDLQSILCQNRWISYLMMPWLLVWRGHHQPWYLTIKIRKFLSSKKVNFSNMPHSMVWNYIKWKVHFYFFRKIAHTKGSCRRCQNFTHMQLKLPLFLSFFFFFNPFTADNSHLYCMQHVSTE